MHKNNIRQLKKILQANNKSEMVSYFAVSIFKIMYFETLPVFWTGPLPETCFLRNYWSDNPGLSGSGTNYSRVGLALGQGFYNHIILRKSFIKQKFLSSLIENTCPMNLIFIICVELPLYFQFDV